MQDEVWRDLAVRYGAELVTEFRVNPDLIGGLRVKIGDDVWDGSVRGRLNRLEQELTAS
jgi:F-type H+-transporting ATPase subunit delta